MSQTKIARQKRIINCILQNIRMSSNGHQLDREGEQTRMTSEK